MIGSGLRERGCVRAARDGGLEGDALTCTFAVACGCLRRHDRRGLSGRRRALHISPRCGSIECRVESERHMSVGYEAARLAGWVDTSNWLATVEEVSLLLPRVLPIPSLQRRIGFRTPQSCSRTADQIRRCTSRSGRINRRSPGSSVTLCPQRATSAHRRRKRSTIWPEPPHHAVYVRIPRAARASIAAAALSIDQRA